MLAQTSTRTLPCTKETAGNRKNSQQARIRNRHQQKAGCTSYFTGLFTEGIKKLLDEMTVKYHSNFLAGGVAVVLSTLVGAGYLILTETQINDKMAVYLIALVLLSWLASMVGYDKVIQAIAQLKRTDNNAQGGR